MNEDGEGDCSQQIEIRKYEQLEKKSSIIGKTKIVN